MLSDDREPVEIQFMTLIELHVLSYISPRLMAKVPESVFCHFRQSRSRIRYRRWHLDKSDHVPLSSRLSTPLQSRLYPSRNSIRLREHQLNVPTMKKYVLRNGIPVS